MTDLLLSHADSVVAGIYAEVDPEETRQ